MQNHCFICLCSGTTSPSHSYVDPEYTKSGSLSEVVRVNRLGWTLRQLCFCAFLHIRVALAASRLPPQPSCATFLHLPHLTSNTPSHLPDVAHLISLLISPIAIHSNPCPDNCALCLKSLQPPLLSPPTLEIRALRQLNPSWNRPQLNLVRKKTRANNRKSNRRKNPQVCRTNGWDAIVA